MQFHYFGIFVKSIDKSTIIFFRNLKAQKINQLIKKLEMQIRDAKIDDYNQIYDLNLKHNLRIPDKNEWEKNMDPKSNFDFREDRIGWVIEDKKKNKRFFGLYKKNIQMMRVRNMMDW